MSLSQDTHTRDRDIHLDILLDMDISISFVDNLENIMRHNRDLLEDKLQHIRCIDSQRKTFNSIEADYFHVAPETRNLFKV